MRRRLPSGVCMWKGHATPGESLVAWRGAALRRADAQPVAVLLVRVPGTHLDEIPTRIDAELRVYPLQVVFDRLGGDAQLPGDVLVAESSARQVGHPLLLGRQLWLLVPPAAPAAGRHELLVRLPGQPPRSDPLAEVERLAQ